MTPTCALLLYFKKFLKWIHSLIIFTNDVPKLMHFSHKGKTTSSPSGNAYKSILPNFVVVINNSFPYIPAILVTPFGFKSYGEK